MKKIFSILLVLSLSMVSYCQKETIYYDGNDNVVASLSFANYYKERSRDTLNTKWLHEQTFYKSGKLKVDVVLSSWNKHEFPIKYEGVYKEWYESGKLSKEIDFKSGIMNGKCFTYWENQKPKRIEYYENGKSSGGKCFNDNGADVPYYQYFQSAEFPGGGGALMRFISQNLRYPAAMQEMEIDGTELVRFVVREDGRISNFEIVKSIAPEANIEAKRIVMMFPKWTPGLVNGDPTPVSFSLPINFRLK